ncbi:hypothetical protein ACIP5Y_32115 [Nocardia sp. NPDC088792]|uniref:hypothetical protein n=1 Tax=Nocardia sp. NPDC088792 TaxID=3364332 RepID=UPI003829D4FF
MSLAISALIPVVLLVLAAGRILVGNRRQSNRWTGLGNPFTQILLVLGLAKLCRVPRITDDVLSPALQRVTGVANLMTLSGMTFGTLSAIPVLAFSSYITGRNLSAKVQVSAAGIIVAAMSVTYLRSPMAHQAVPFLQNHFAVTGAVAAYWIVFIAPLTISTLVGFAYTVRELSWVRRGPFARALAGVAATYFLGFTYCAVNVVNLVLKYTGTDSFLFRHSEPIENSLGLASLAAAGFSAATYAWHNLRDRLHRYRLLRLRGHTWLAARSASPEVVLDRTYRFRPTRRACWSAARSAQAAYRLRMELADHEHQTAKQSVVA